MNLALWILQGLLAATFLVSVMLKLFMPRLELANKAPWANHFSERALS